MKSAYCAAIFLCSAMLWLQEKKKACGIDQNRYLKTAVGYGLTRFLLPVIAQQSMKGSVTVLAMDLVICGLVFYLSKRDSEQSYAAESLFFYVWNPVPAMAALSQEKNRMVVIWLSVLIFVWMVRCTEKNAEKDADSDKSSGVAYSYRLWSLSGVLWIWGRDIAGQSIRQYIAGDGAYPVLLLLSVIAGIAAVLMIFVGLMFRAVGVSLCMLGTKLNKKERLFCVIAYLPKATVQAAIGSVPLAMGLPCGQIVLSVAVLAILITAPLGAAGMDLTYDKLLVRSED